MSRIVLVYRPGHPRADKYGFVNRDELHLTEESLAINAGICSGRFYENTKATDGTDIGSRSKHRDWMKKNGYAHQSDYGADYGDRVRAAQDRAETKSIREAVERNFHAIDRKTQR